MDIDAALNVVEQVPADVIGVFVDDELVATIPAPVRSKGPIPVRDLEVETIGEPEPMVVAINAGDGVAVGGAEMFKVAVVKGAVDVKAPVVWGFVTIPVIVVHMRGVIDGAILPVLLFPFEVVRAGFRRRRRDMPLIGARNILVVVLWTRFRLLCGTLG